MSELPRPATPGPWYLRGYEDERWVGSDEGVVVYDIGAEGSVRCVDDLPAIAALPDWIARADRLEALLREAMAMIDESGIYIEYIGSGDDFPDRLLEFQTRAWSELHGGDPTPSADDCGHSRGHSEEGDD